jgi:hypothetical protein
MRKNIRIENNEKNFGRPGKEGRMSTRRTVILKKKMKITIKTLRKKENSIYDPNTKFFDEPEDESGKEGSEDKKKQKPKGFKDVVCEHILEQMDDDEKEASNKDDESKPMNSKFAYV